MPTRLTSLFVEGFTASGAPLATTATSLTWSIYPDSAGKPAGNPETAPGAAVWTYTASPVQAGVDTTNNNISLDLVQAGQNVNLPAGKYWLVVHARTSFDQPLGVVGVERREWLVHGDHAEPGRLDFEQQFARPRRPHPRRSQLRRALDRRRDADDGAGGSDTSTGVQVQLSTSGLAAGSHGGYLCLSTNDAARPKAAARIKSPSRLDLKRAPAQPAPAVDLQRLRHKCNARVEMRGRCAVRGT